MDREKKSPARAILLKHGSTVARATFFKPYVRWPGDGKLEKPRKRETGQNTKYSLLPSFFCCCCCCCCCRPSQETVESMTSSPEESEREASVPVITDAEQLARGLVE
jgi:hypothetical protein